MEILGVGGSTYNSPYGAEALKQQISSVNMQDGKQDAYITTHKVKDNTASIIGSAIVTFAAAFGLYKGKGKIGSAFNFAKETAGKLYDKVKDTGIAQKLTENGKKVFENIQNKFPNIKSKFSSIKIPEALKSIPSKIGDAFQTIKSKFHK